MTVTSAALYEKEMYTQGHWEVITVNPLLTSTPRGLIKYFERIWEGGGGLMERGVYLF